MWTELMDIQQADSEMDIDNTLCLCPRELIAPSLSMTLPSEASSWSAPVKAAALAYCYEISLLVAPSLSIASPLSVVMPWPWAYSAQPLMIPASISVLLAPSLSSRIPTTVLLEA